MAVFDIEFKLQLEIINWECTRSAKCVVDFDGNLGHMKLGMRGLLWSIQTLELQSPGEYSFNIMEVKRSETPLSLSEATPADLPAKFKFLLVALQTYIRSVFRVEEFLDKLYACSLFFFLAENDKRWWIIVDAQIMAVACNTAREAIQQAAEAAAAFLAEIMPCFYQENTSIYEVYATSFSATEIWNRIALAAVDGGNVHQWCKFQVLESEKMIPCFEFEVAVQDFLQGNDEISKIGVSNSHALKVTVGLEDEIWVVCSQEGVETETSSGLGLVLPQLIRNYIATAVERNECELDGDNNIAEGLVQRVVGYLAFLPRVCGVCGSHRLLEVSLTSTCSYLCEARKDICRGSLPFTRSDGQWNMEEAQEGLSTLLLEDDDDDDDDGNESAENPFN